MAHKGTKSDVIGLSRPRRTQLVLFLLDLDILIALFFDSGTRISLFYTFFFDVRYRQVPRSDILMRPPRVRRETDKKGAPLLAVVHSEASVLQLSLIPDDIRSARSVSLAPSFTEYTVNVVLTGSSIACLLSSLVCIIARCSSLNTTGLSLFFPVPTRSLL
jgi:hypothetical protein